MSTALLLAEPELDTRVFLERHLKNDGFRVVDGQAQPDLVRGDELDGLLQRTLSLRWGHAHAHIADLQHETYK